jgi:hypothetical protein
MDLVVGDDAGHVVTVLLNDGTGVFATSRSYATQAYPGSVVVADLKGDGRLDVVAAARGSNAVDVLTGGCLP